MPNDPHNLDDVDAVLVALVLQAEKMKPLRDAEAVAVRAILALSRTRIPAAMKEARQLMADLTVGRQSQ